MTKLIGHITYPQEASLAVEYTKLYSEDDATLLEFRLVNHGKKTVNAYRLDLSYSVNGEEKSETVQGRNLELLSGSRTDVITMTLPSAVEEGTITLSAVIYDDLTHNQTAPSFPFASFDTVSRAAEAVLSGATPVAVTKKSTQATATTTATTTKEAETEPSGKKSHLPLILALCALGGIVLTVILRLFSGYFLHLAIDGVIGGM